MRPSLLPPALGPTFTTLRALDAGVPPSRLRAGDLASPFHGVRVLGSSGVEAVRLRARERDIASLARAYAERMGRHEFFSHVTAAVLWDLPLPWAVIDPGVLHVSVLAPKRAPRSRGIVGHQARATTTAVGRHPEFGWHLSSPASTWASVAPMLSHPYDVVALADAIARIPRMPGLSPRPSDRSLATLEELEACVRAGRRIGIEGLRAALPLVRTGSSSRPETWTRLILVDAGLPEPILDHDVFDEYGTFLACVDLAYPALRIAIEYEGDHHRVDPVQWAHDVDRIEGLTEHGWRVIRVTKALVFRHPSELVRRVRAARAAAA
ncbi:hypothetical protein HII28_08505 [Planctomonas sp. JC2975]|uniref:endonuclease domain-containing protein n=1 Tax=Planctomonas sp. JC2975 TaxID=2729626 RepID=UPI0014762ACE|nr:hypothetical protein [Planctomonas sp. JC2975]NNC11919.1 hypothetical protein [Planctomonas sp. JC2975]